jgi:hypothetical protein
MEATMKRLLTVLAFAVLPSAASADLFVMGNNETGAVVIRGNLPNGAEADEAGSQALAKRKTGWTQLLEDDTPGWGAVACVRTKDEVYFSVANGHKSEGEAMQQAIGGAKLFIQKNGDGILVPNCAPRWNNQGQQISLDADQAPEWKVADDSPGAIDYAKAAAHKAAGVTPGFNRDCAKPKPAPEEKSDKTEASQSGRKVEPVTNCKNASGAVRG